MKYQCNKASECKNTRCSHNKPHREVNECCSAVEGKCWSGFHDYRCIPVECEWRVRQSEATGKNWLVANGSTWDNTAKWLHADGVVRPTSSDARHPTESAAQAALDKYLGKEKQVEAKKVPKIRKSQSEPGYMVGCTHIEYLWAKDNKIHHNWRSREDGCGLFTTKAAAQKALDFYETNKTKETDMGQKLYTTALAVTSTDEETGAVTIKSVTDPETTDAVRLNQAMIARDRIQARKQGKDKPEVVGQLDDQTWKRMDDI